MKILIYLGAYFGILFFVSWLLSRKQQSEDFLIASRNRKGWQLLLSYFASSIGAGYFLTYTGLAYQYGWGVFLMMAGLVSGTLLFGYWAAPRVAALAKKEKFYTLGHFVASRYNSKYAGPVANILGSAILFGWLVVGMIGGGHIIADLGLMPYNVSLLVTALILSYLLLAGYRAVIITDVVQSIIILALLGFITYSIVGRHIPTLTGGFSGQPVDLAVAAGFFVYGVLAAFSYSETYQLVYSGKRKADVRHGLGLSVIPVLIVGFFLLLIGIFMARVTPGLDTGLVFTEAIKRFLDPALVPLAIILFFTGVVSSSDTSVFAISSHVASYIKGDLVKNTRRSIAVLLVLVTAIAFVIPSVVQASLLAAGLSLTLSWAMIYTIAGGRNVRRFIGSIVAAFVGLSVGVVLYGLGPGAALPTVLGGLLGLTLPGWPFRRISKTHSRLGDSRLS